MDFGEADGFVRLMLQESNKDDELTGTAAVVVSTLSTIIQLASHVQELATNCPEMRNIALGVYGTVLEGGWGEGNKLVSLFGPRIEGTDERSLDGRAERSRSIVRVPRLGVDTEGSDREERGTGAKEIDVNLMERGGNGGMGISRDMERQPETVPVLAPRNQNNENTYLVPEHVAVKCMSYLLDMSGCTSHPRINRGKDVENINARLVQSAVKAIFKRHKERISRRGVRSHGVQYISLVPESSKGKEIIFPRLCLSRSRSGCSFVREGELRTNFSIGKADRNRKEQNIALMASLLHHRGHGVDIEDILTQFAKKGLGPEGCTMFGGCRASSLRMPCKDAPRDNCVLYCEVNGGRKIVGKGTPDPFLTFALGKEIPQTAIAMRVKTVTCPAGMEKRRSDGCAVHDDLYLWPKSDVGRVEFLGEFKDVLGSAILVCMLLPSRQESEVVGTNAAENATNIADAVILCDVQLAAGREREIYPFEEWYSNALVRKIRELQYETPKQMQNVVTQSSKAMLWNFRLLREV